jgi:hypothetical protein
VGDGQPDEHGSEFLDLPGVDPEEAEEEVEPLDASGAEAFDPREVGVVSEEELPGEPIDPSLPKNKMRQEARRWVGRDLGRPSLSAEMTEEGEHICDPRHVDIGPADDPIDEEELRIAETKELKDRKRELQGRRREAKFRKSDLPLISRKDVPETVRQKKLALGDEQRAARTHVQQIEKEIKRRPRKAEGKVRSALEKAKDLGRVLERGTVKKFFEQKPLTKTGARKKRARRARALDRAEKRLGSLGPEERREIRRRIEENRPGLAEVLEEAEDPSRQSADQMEKKQARRRRERHASRARGRVEGHLAGARRAEEKGRKARKHEALDAVETEIEELSLGTGMTEGEAEKAVAEGLSREERSLLREATAPGRPSAEEIRGGGGQGKSSGQGEGNSEDRSQGGSEDRSQGGSEDGSEDRGRGQDRGWGQDRGYDRGLSL